MTQATTSSVVQLRPHMHTPRLETNALFLSLERDLSRLSEISELYPELLDVAIGSLNHLNEYLPFIIGRMRQRRYG